MNTSHFERFAQRYIRHGSLEVHVADKLLFRAGQGEPRAQLYLRRTSVLRRLLRTPDISFGEAYMDGDWWPGEGGLLRLFELYYANGEPRPLRGLRALARRALGLLGEANNHLRARRNIQEHYDLDAELFRLFLDPELNYSCAYFETGQMSLEDAQQAKCRHIANKLLLEPGQRVLDIGSGWGALGIYLARHFDVDVTGITLSEDQYQESRRRARALGLESRLRFYRQDYREHEGHYDAVVSVGMFEHVGRPQYQTFFDGVEKLLKPGGRVLIHSIGRNEPPCDSGGWVQRYIFPGGYIPALSEVARPIERCGLALTDVEIWRLHYAKTLAHWNQRFRQNRSTFEARLGERFCRMWEFYLLGSEAIFRWGNLVVFQLQLATHENKLPLTRDYLYTEKTAAAVDNTVKKAG